MSAGMGATRCSSGGSAQVPQPQLALRILAADYYCAERTTPLDQVYNHASARVEPRKVKVPVIRLFGCLPNGRKACILVHRYYPCLYVPFDDATAKGSVLSPRSLCSHGLAPCLCVSRIYALH